MKFMGSQTRSLTAPHERIAQLLSDLDADDFAVREKASAELAKLGETARRSLWRAPRQQPSPEVEHRLKRLLEQKDTDDTANAGRELLRGVRAVEVLEAIGTPEAKAVLTALAEAKPSTWLTEEAKASLKRMQR